VDRLDRIGGRALAAALTSLACQRAKQSEAFAQRAVWSTRSSVATRAFAGDGTDVNRIRTRDRGARQGR
jgi:hypothetical protein